MAKHKVQVVVPHRDGHNFMGAARKTWAEGVHDVELTDAELTDILHRPQMTVIQDGKQVKTHADLKGYVKPATAAEARRRAHEHAKHFSADVVARQLQEDADEAGGVLREPHAAALLPSLPAVNDSATGGKVVQDESDVPNRASKGVDEAPPPEELPPLPEPTPVADTSMPFPDEPMAPATTELDDGTDTKSEGKKPKHGKRF